jgi:hypothetical protein
VRDALRDNESLSWAKFDRSPFQVDDESTFRYIEELILMHMPVVGPSCERREAKGRDAAAKELH